MARSTAAGTARWSWFERRWVLWVSCLWGFAEATLFFVVPDVLLTLVALYSPRRTVKLVAFILLGALAGGSLMFYVGAHSPERAKETVLRVPFVVPAMFDKTHRGFESDGLWTLAKAPGNGIPYKVYCVQASGYGRWLVFLGVSIVARLERFAPFWIVSAGLGLAFAEQIRRRPKIPAIAHLILWILGYTLYWSRI